MTLEKAQKAVKDLKKSMLSDDPAIIIEKYRLLTAAREPTMAHFLAVMASGRVNSSGNYEWRERDIVLLLSLTRDQEVYLNIHLTDRHLDGTTLGDVVSGDVFSPGVPETLARVVKIAKEIDPDLEIDINFSITAKDVKIDGEVV